ncbi:MAG: hypothetical protein KAR22_10960 [Gammaproteobacteria bacterium]|nr:hypothetical protein [Gammaproteobacteria bacterium]
MPRSLPSDRTVTSLLQYRAPTRTPGRRWFPGLAMAMAMLLGMISHQTPAQEALTGDQIRSLITGNTLQGNFMANPLTMVFYADGVVRGAIGLTGSDSGTWEIEGDNYCNEWVTYFSGVRRCYQWISQGKSYLLKNVDAYRARNIQGQIKEGKPKGY